jgi:hypothetical protein
MKSLAYSQNPAVARARRRAALLLLIGCCLAVPATNAQKVKIEFDQEADFSRVRSYEWRDHPVFEKHPELKEVYATGIQIVLTNGNSLLMKQGLKPADSQPDVYVTFFLHATTGHDVRYVDYGGWWGAGYGWYGPPSWTTVEIDNFLSGMLVMDIVDAKTSRLLWRAYCGDKVRDFANRHKNINDMLKKALRQFPPKQKSK